jgi:D-sedoheptulose 7-phosphate isomerase
MPSSHGSSQRRADAGRRFQDIIVELQETFGSLGTVHVDAIYALAEAVFTSWQEGGKLLLCGNGGSAADAQHIAAELVGRFLADRRAYPALALTTNSSIMTSVGNDYGFDQIFARQVTALGRPGDVLLAISTSGNSPNVIEAVAEARRIGLRIFGFLGCDGGRLLDLVDVALVVPSQQTPRIQEVHITMGHLLCRLLEDWQRAAAEPTGGTDDG